MSRQKKEVFLSAHKIYVENVPEGDNRKPLKFVLMSEFALTRYE
jgi:hypothetical protein